MSESRPQPIDLVPVGERMRMITWFRLAASAVILVACWAWPPAGASSATVTVVVLSYVAIAGAVEYAWRHAKKPWPSTFGVLAMADSALLVWCSYGAYGLDSPLRYLLVLQLITFSLLASFRTGLKLALFTTWLLFFAVYSGEANIAGGLEVDSVEIGDANFWRLLADVAMLLGAAILTATFASVNEKELRRSRFDLERLAELALELDDADSPAEVGAAVLSGIDDVYDCKPSMFLSEGDGRWTVLAQRGFEDTAAIDRPLPPTAPTISPIVERALKESRTLLVARAGTQPDPLFQTFDPHANVIVLPLTGSGKRASAAIVAEYPARRGSRIERRMVSMLERFAAHSDLELTNAFLLAEVRAAAVTDALTGLANRRHLDRILTESCDQASRGHGSLGLMMIDIDHFKKLNDTHGHQTGDEVLKAVAKVIGDTRQVGELAARYGGEEFSCVLPGLEGDALVDSAERLRRAITEMGGDIPVTVSIGVASVPADGTDRDTLVAAADAALYRAKEGGRNRVVASAPIPTVLHELKAS